VLDAVVIGGGPIGSRTAFRLAGLGYKVAVLEKKAGAGEKACCTGIVSRECVSAYGIDPAVIFRQVNSAKIWGASGELIRLYRPETQAAIINRPAFDRWLADKSQSQGADYHFQSGVESLSFEKNKVIAEVAGPGRRYHVEAQTAVLANGFNSLLVKKLGLKNPEYRVGGAQVEVEMKDLAEVEIFFNQRLAPGFFAWLVPTAWGKGLAGLLTNHSPGGHLREWITRLQEEGRITGKIATIRYGGIPLKPLPRTFGDRFLVVGDAAGQVKPTTGGGLYFGLLCADIAAETLHTAFQEADFSLRKMSLYERNWRQKIGPELRREYLARRLYEHLSNRQIEGLFSRLKSSGVVESLLREEQLSFDWHGGLMMKVLKAGLESLWPFHSLF
jgi:digeranylgeranylglycerophospholipid reductase